MTKTAERVTETGEVFTPSWLVKDTLNKIPQLTDTDLLRDNNPTVIDPAAGDGAFIIEVLERKLRAEVAPLQALKTTYAVELMSDNVLVMHKRIRSLLSEWLAVGVLDLDEHFSFKKILQYNYICANSLDFNYRDFVPFIKAEEDSIHMQRACATKEDLPNHWRLLNGVIVPTTEV